MGLRAVRALLAIVVVLTASASPAGASGGEGERVSTAIPTLESSVIVEVNVARRSRGLRPLRLSRGLAASAGTHTLAMARRGLFTHELPGGPSFTSRLRSHYPPRGRGWSVGENMAAVSPTPTARETVQMWLASAPHRRNLLSPRWREIGVAALFAPDAPGDFGDADMTIVTADFGVRG